MNQQPDPAGQVADREAALLCSADVRIVPVRIALPYQLGLVVVAAAMLLLPVLYVALIGVLAFFVWMHAVHSPAVIFQAGIGIWRAAVYVGPLVAGAVGVLFMIKPILAKPPKPPRPLGLARTNQSLLFEFVERLCRALGAPPPQEIRVDMQVNASASYRRGLRSLFGKDLVLTLGMPLAAGLNVDQLAGILAHEFGHFSQTTAMRFTYVIARINHWFARVVYERDQWDLKLTTWSENATTGFVQFVLLLAQFSVWLSRRILWILMYVGHALSAFLSRQMEHNADAHEVQLIGSAGFRQTYLRMGLLQIATQSALGQVEKMWAERRLARDLPALVLVHAERIEQNVETMSQIERGMLEQRARMFDTHPSGAERIRRAERSTVTPAMTCPEPASALFRKFGSLAERSTLAFYQSTVGEETGNAALVGPEDAAAGLAKAVALGQATERVAFGGAVMGFGIAPKSLEPVVPSSVPAGIAALERARQHTQSLRGSVPSLVNDYDTAYDKLQRVGTALLLDAAGMRYSPKDLDLPTKETAALLALEQSTEEERQRAREAMRPVFAAIEDRVDAAVALAMHPNVRPRLADAGPTLANFHAIGETLVTLAASWQQLARLGTKCRDLSMLVNGIDAYGGDEHFQGHIQRVISETFDLLGRLFGRLNETPYPFEHAHGTVSIARYAVPTRPTADIQILDHALGALNRVMSLYERCWGEIAALVEEVEAAVGMAPLDAQEGTNSNDPPDDRP
jgi:Zn-dependent protease with chaperone function